MVFQYLRPQWRLAVILAFLLVGTTGLQLLGPDFLGSFVDGVTRAEPTEDPVLIGVAYLAAAVGAGALKVAMEWIGMRLAWRTTNQLREDLLSHCLHQDLAFYDNHSPGELIERIDGDVRKLANFASKLLILLTVNALMVLGIGAMLWRIDWRFGVGFAVLTVALLATVRRLVGAAVVAAAEVSEATADMSGYVEERLRGLEDVAATGSAGYAMHGLFVRSKRLFMANRRSAALQIRWPAAAQHFSSVMVIAGLGGSIAMHLSGDLTIGQVYTVMAYLTMMRIPVFVIARQMSELDDAMASIRRSKELFAIRPAIVSGHQHLPPGPLALRLSGVNFGYGDQQVLHDVSLDLSAGRHLALVGVTGGGKTSIARLAARVVDPDAGYVALSGTDLRELDTGSLRSRVSYVTQDVTVMATSVRDNVTVFDESVQDDQLVDVLARVGLGDWLHGLPDGLDTGLGTEVKLSAGQEQLLAVGRALIRDPGLVVLDEATARIPPSERLAVTSALRQLLHGRTAIIIAHRLDTIADADEIAVVADGQVIEHHSDRAALRSRGTGGLAAPSGSRLAALLAAGEVA